MIFDYQGTGPLTDDFNVDDLDDATAGVVLEPSATQRRFAGILYGTYVALRQAGFTEDQALTIVVGVIHSVDDVLDTDQ